MSQQKASFIKVPTDITGGVQTMPVEPEKRLPESEISIELCTEKDAEKIAEGLYTCFSESWWNKKEPLELRPEQSIRVKRMAKRLLPSFTTPDQYFVKAVLVSTGEVIGIAGWTGPGNKGIQNVFTRSAIDHYGWQETMGWTNDEIDEMFEHVSPTDWNEQFDKGDKIRAELMGEEPHWYLAPLLTWPEYQGRGVGKRLLNWAIEQADATEPVTPMYLESAATARAVYMHCGFVPQGEVNMIRRGPAVVRGLEVDDETGKTDTVPKEKLGGINVEVVGKEIEAETLV